MKKTDSGLLFHRQVFQPNLIPVKLLTAIYLVIQIFVYRTMFSFHYIYVASLDLTLSNSSHGIHFMSESSIFEVFPLNYIPSVKPIKP